MLNRIKSLLLATSLMLSLIVSALAERSPKSILSGEMIPLFVAYPSLQSRLPRVELLSEATAVKALTNLEHKLNPKHPSASASLWMKMDDRSDNPLGGNKARKLEFILGKVIKHDDHTLVTSGMYGSNHALATAVVARMYGLSAKLILGPQPVTENVRQKLLASHALGAELHFNANIVEMGSNLVASEFKAHFKKGVSYIPPGGSSNRGSTGYVNAFFELKEQMSNKDFPKRIIVPAGSGGTVAGLLVGSCLAGLWDKVEIVAVGVAPTIAMNEIKLRAQALTLLTYLKRKMNKKDKRKIPRCDFIRSKKALSFISNYVTPGYGESNKKVDSVISKLELLEQVKLDSTYSGKAMAYFIDDYNKRISKGDYTKSLFWMTYSSYDLQNFIDQHSWKSLDQRWKDLPSEFHQIFKE